MYIPGHVSVAYLAGHAREVGTGLDEPAVTRGLYVCILAGALYPDLVDKLHMYLGFSPFSRTWGHSVFAIAAVGVIWVVMRLLTARGSRPLGWFLAGWATHFAADFANDLVAGVWYTGYVWSPWFLWPVFDADDLYWEYAPVIYPCRGCYTFLEVGAVLLALYVARKSASGES